MPTDPVLVPVPATVTDLARDAVTTTERKLPHEASVLEARALLTAFAQSRGEVTTAEVRIAKVRIVETSTTSVRIMDMIVVETMSMIMIALRLRARGSR